MSAVVGIQALVSTECGEARTSTNRALTRPPAAFFYTQTHTSETPAFPPSTADHHPQRHKHITLVSPHHPFSASHVHSPFVGMLQKNHDHLPATDLAAQGGVVETAGDERGDDGL